VQLSAALSCPADHDAWETLQPFAEGTYLHQVKGRGTDGSIRSWTDLPAAIADLEGRQNLEDIRVHFHVPLFFRESGFLSSTPPRC
jgi:hypothetical protein